MTRGPAPFVLAVVASCGPHAAPAPAAPVATETCDGHAVVPVDDGAYLVQANEWRSDEPQCLAVHGTGFALTRADFHLPTQGPPATYPSTFKGCHWGTCTKDSGLPLLAATLPAVTSSWEVQTAGGAYDAAYDLWFNKSPQTSGAPDGAELMIWLDHGGGIGSAGVHTATVAIDGATWEVWQTQMAYWKYIAYLRTEPTNTAHDLDLRAFVRDAIARGSVDPSSYLIDVEAGFEVWQGGRGMASRALRVSVGDAAR
jgi:cellulose 1,4-beta-cellobiosidase